MIKTYKNAFKIIPNEVLFLTFIISVAYIGLAYRTYYSLFLQQYAHISIIYIGYVIGLIGAGSLIGTKITSGFLNRYKPSLIIASSFLGLSISTFMSVLVSQSLIALLICFFSIGFTSSFFRPAFLYIISEIDDDLVRKNAFSMYRLFISIGSTIGILMGGFLADISYPLMICVFSIMALIPAIVLFCMKAKEDHKHEKDDDKDEKNSQNIKEKHPLFNKSFLFALLKLSIFSIIIFQQTAFIPIYYIDYLSISKSQLSIIYTTGFIFKLIFEVYLVNLLHRYSNYVSLFLGAVITSIGFFLISFHFSNFIYLLISYAFVCLGSILFWPILLSDVTKISESMCRKKEYLVWYEMIISFTLLIYTIIGSLIISYSSIYMFWKICSAAALFICLIIVIELKLERNTKIKAMHLS